MGDKLGFDPYDLFEVDEQCSDKEILKAFRKMALKWHPDKNPDRLALATEMFLKVQKAFEILTDAAAKSALDRLRKAQKAAKIRTKELDEKRRKLKEELESRENKSKSDKEDEVKAEKSFEAEIERLRREGSKLLQKEKEEIDRQVSEELLNSQSAASTSVDVNVKTPNSARLKVRWKVCKTDGSVYTEQKIRNIFSKYGRLGGVVIGKNPKLGSALVEFQELFRQSKQVELETGEESCPMKTSWVSLPPDPEPVVITDTKTKLITHEDFESQVLSKLKQAEERKRLIEQMMQDDDDES